MRMMRPVQALLDRQYRRPSGLLGYFVGAQMVRQHEPEMQWTLSLLSLKSTDHVLEIGCGAGRALEIVTAQVPAGHVSGIDYSPTMIEASRRRNSRAIAMGHLELFQADVMQLPFADASFDTIWSIHSIYFWPDRDRALAEIARVLKPGGLLVLTFSPGKTGTQAVNDILTMVEEQQIPTMRQLGFSNVSLQQGPASRQFRTSAVAGQKERAS
ncbi:MAG TPA: class I SAM-dependent methyltransferase [Ktedonobacteraceae bacterium]|jgi:ubiquinone/menaquinone biosynthesis C-methylase UbiE|nr:class I SAM-dependent methyltransferase [Ktedonobacteraceae bacterium]